VDESVIDEREALQVPESYLEEAERPETEGTLRERLPQKLRRIADNRLVNLAKEAYAYTTHPAISRRHKLIGAGALLYLIAPLDAVADWIPGLGYIDDAAVLTAFVVSVRDAVKEVVSHTQQAAADVVTHAVSEAREAWARRGLSQVCLSLWAATAAACVGLLYYGARTTVLAPSGGAVPGDPFFWACMLAGALGFVYQLVFAFRVWRRYAAARPEIKEPLAYAIVSLADWRNTLALALPVIVLMLLVLLRGALAVQG
jgi:uncharacterized membrane protein YkvA (DUF1232 family)